MYVTKKLEIAATANVAGKLNIIRENSVTMHMKLPPRFILQDSLQASWNAEAGTHLHQERDQGSQLVTL